LEKNTLLKLDLASAGLGLRFTALIRPFTDDHGLLDIKDIVEVFFARMEIASGAANLLIRLF